MIIHGTYSKSCPEMSEAAEHSVLPVWLGRRLPYLRQTGIFRFVGEQNIDLSYFSHPQVLRTLFLAKVFDISRTTLTTLAGLPYFPRLTVFVADGSELATFANFRTLTTVTSFSLKDTPVSKLPNYRLSLLLVVGTKSVRSIDGRQISSALKANYERFPSVCREFANAGWVASAQPPTRAEIRSLCSQYSIEEPLFVPDSENDDRLSSALQDSTGDFDGLLNKLRAEHREVWRKGRAQFGLVNEGTTNTREFAESIGEVLRRHGIDANVDTDDQILETVESLFSQWASHQPPSDVNPV
jgi:hypothetical protein